MLLQGGFRPIALTMDNREIPGGPRYSITNRDGQFAFFDLTPGTYAFEANKAGFLAGAYGRLRPGGQAQSINLKEGEHLTSIRIPIWEYGSVAGTIRDETGEAVVGVFVRALRRAVVNGNWRLTSASSAATNDRGEYRIDLLPPGRYVLVVAATQTSMPLPTPESRAAGGMSIELARAGLSPSSGAGRQIGDWLWNSSRSAMTIPNPRDDGRFLVYPTTFYPSARSSREAETIALESGQERSAVDLRLQLVPATLVSGVVMGLEGPLASTVVRLVPEYAKEFAGDLQGLETAATVTDAAGRFLFVGVPVGQYFAQGSVPSTAPPNQVIPSKGAWLNEAVTVSEGGASDLTLTFRPGVKVSGRIFFDGTKPPPPPDLVTRFSVSLEVLDFGINRGEAPYQSYFDRDGQFLFPAVPPGEYIITFRAALADRRLMPDWETKGGVLEGRDITDRPLTITSDVNGIIMALTDHNSELNGTARDAAGKPDPAAAVLLFTAEKELWPLRMTRRIRALRASETGTYSVRGVPPGDYFLVAIPDRDLADFPDPRMLEMLTKIATRFQMAPSEHKTVELTVKSVR